jgi:hypothetical protein
VRRRDWRDMSPTEFDADAPVEESPGLFDLTVDMVPPPDDGVGTGDLFTDLDQPDPV